MSTWFPGARRQPRPWWEPEDDPNPAADRTTAPEPAATVRPTLTLTPERETPLAAATTLPPADSEPPRPLDPVQPPLQARATPGITARGVFVVMAVPAAVGTAIGFLLSGAGAISPLAGWGLLLGSVFAGLKASPRLGWFPAFLPPLAMLTVVAVLGQVTLVGSWPSLIREVAMVLAGLTATAPAQLGSVTAVTVILYWRRRASASRH